MKRRWLLWVSLGLVLALSVPAWAVDVKINGSYYAAGMYQDKTTFIKNGYYLAPDEDDQLYPVPVVTSPSTAFFYQRLRVQTDFVVSPSLKLVTRFDAMERIWGGSRSAPDTILDSQSAGTRAENENIAFDWAYVEYVSPIGMFDVGYMEDGGWGTIFGDTSVPRGVLSWAAQKGPWTVFFQILKVGDNSNFYNHSTYVTDNDTDKYQFGGFYEWKNGQAGLLAIYYRDASMRPITPAPGVDWGVTGKVYVLQPYAIVNIGPAKIQAELDYAWGDIKADTPPGYFGQDLKVDNLAAWVDATVNAKMFYFGGSVAYVAGTDWNKFNSEGKITGGFLTGGMDWNPTLLLFNNERQYWAGTIYGHNITSTNMNFISQMFGLNDTGIYNAWFFQGRAGIRPNEKLDVMASVSYAMADSKTLPAGMPDAVSGEYGTEIDLIGTYKITDNLKYMLGFGYLFTGEYFKGYDPTAELSNNYILINKLTLNF